MPKACVKNVNKQCINWFKPSENLSTISQKFNKQQVNCLKNRVLNYYLNHISTIIYTGLYSEINLLNKSFTHYPQHLLIIKTNKER